MTREIKISNFKSIQAAIDAAEANSILILDSGTYYESIVIDKPLKIINKTHDAVIKLEEFQITIVHAGEVTFEGIRFELLKTDRGVGITTSESSLIMNSCAIKAVHQVREGYSCLWIESGSLMISDSKIESHANFLKIINGKVLDLKSNDMEITAGDIAFEIHDVDDISICENIIQSDINLFKITKSSELVIDKNRMRLNYAKLNQSVMLRIEGFEHGERLEITENKIVSDREINISISNSHSISRKVILSTNEFTEGEGYHTKIMLNHLQGRIELAYNKLPYGMIHAVTCSELLLRQNEVLYLLVKQLNQLMAIDNKFLNHINVENVRFADFKKNQIINSGTDKEAVKFSEVDKLVFEQNRVSSVDHGITLLNAGDNLEISILKNEFKGCRKRSINIASTMQKKYLKTEINIASNIFIRNDKAIYIDDRNLKSCSIHENYFGENKEAIIVSGGKSTGSIKVSGNYFERTNQCIELRAAQICRITHNEMSDCKLSARGCDEIVIDGNHFDKLYNNSGRSFNNEVCIKSGGSLSVSHNMMLVGKKRHERKEIIERLNITSYERQSAMSIFDNKVLEAFRKKSFFESEPEKELILYPDDSLLATLQYQIHKERKSHATDMSIDDVMKADFYKYRDRLNDLKEHVMSKMIKDAIADVMAKYQLEIFAGSDSNDIYRFMAKTNETIEMLKIYTSMEHETDVTTEKRVIAVLSNYRVILDQMMQTQSESEHDKLNAQLKLLENLL